MVESASDESYEMADLVTSSQSDVQQEEVLKEDSSEDKESEYDVQNSSIASKSTPKRRPIRKTIAFLEDSEEESEEKENLKKKTVKRKSILPKKINKKIVKSSPVEEKIYFGESEVLHGLVEKHNLEGATLKLFLAFYKSNRPSSSTELALSFPKKLLENSLKELVEKELLICKTYNKSKMYMMNTDACNYEELDVLEDRLSKLKERTSALKEEISVSQGHFSILQNQLTNGELEQKIEEIKFQIEQNKLNILRVESGELCKEEEIEKIKTNLKKYLKIEKERKSIFSNIVDVLSENLNLKKKDLYEEIGIDYD